MFKSLVVLCLFTITGMAMGSPLEHTMSMKERIRLSLWIEGLESQTKQKQSPKPQKQLPEEIERPLRNLI